MRVNLAYGARYRAVVVLADYVRKLVPAETLKAELARYQLIGRVTESRSGYMVEAEFRGRTGCYELPDSVTSVERIK